MNKKENLESASREIKKIVKSGTIKEKVKLIGLLDSDNRGIVELAQSAMVHLASGKKELIKKLMDTAVSSSLSIRLRSNSFDTIKHIAMQDGNFLLDYTEKNNGKYDRIVAEIIRYGSFAPKDFPKKALKNLANSSDEITRANAIESIGILKINLGDILIKALDSNSFVLSAAIFALGELKLKKAFPKLKEILLNTDDRVIKNIITEYFSKIGGNEATDFLLELLNGNLKYKLDKIYILKSLYKICVANNCANNGKNSYKEKMYFKLSKMNLKISIHLLSDYEDKDAVDSILCYFSLLNHKKSRKTFKFIFEYYQKNDFIDEIEYGYIKDILKKIARPKFIIEFIKSLKISSDFNSKIDLLIDVLSEISPKETANLLDFYKDRKLFIEIKLSILKYAKNITVRSCDGLLADAVINYYIKDTNGDVRKSAVKLLSFIDTGCLYLEKIFNNLLKEKYTDVIDSYIETLSNLVSLKKNKKYIYYFIDNLSIKNTKIIEYSLRILGNKKLALSEKEFSDLYGKLTAFRHNKVQLLNRLLAKMLKNMDLMNHKDEMSFLLKENDEDTKLNYLESLFLSGEKNPEIFFNVFNSGNYSDIFKYKIIELIRELRNKNSFDELASILRKEKSKMVKIALLQALHHIDKEKSDSILKKYNSSRDKDLRNFSLELIKI